MGKVISYWSIRGGVGKTTLALAKSKLLCDKGNKVAILDFDEINPHIHRLLGIEFKNPIDLLESLDGGIKKAYHTIKVKVRGTVYDQSHSEIIGR